MTLKTVRSVCYRLWSAAVPNSVTHDTEDSPVCATGCGLLRSLTLLHVTLKTVRSVCYGLWSVVVPSSAVVHGSEDSPVCATGCGLLRPSSSAVVNGSEDSPVWLGSVGTMGHCQKVSQRAHLSPSAVSVPIGTTRGKSAP